MQALHGAAGEIAYFTAVVAMGANVDLFKNKAQLPFLN